MLASVASEPLALVRATLQKKIRTAVCSDRFCSQTSWLLVILSLSVATRGGPRWEPLRASTTYASRQSTSIVLNRAMSLNRLIYLCRQKKIIDPLPLR